MRTNASYFINIPLIKSFNVIHYIRYECNTFALHAMKYDNYFNNLSKTQQNIPIYLK